MPTFLSSGCHHKEGICFKSVDGVADSKTSDSRLVELAVLFGHEGSEMLECTSENKRCLQHATNEAHKAEADRCEEESTRTYMQ